MVAEGEFGGGNASNALRSIFPLSVSGRRRKEHKIGRYHILGQFGPECTAQSGDGAAVGCVGHEISNQSFVTLSVFAKDDYGLPNSLALLKRCFNLAGLNAMAAQLDLKVDAAEKLNVSVLPDIEPDRPFGTAVDL